MRRRQFITMLGGAVAWPLAGRAQQPAVPVVGFLSPVSPGGPVSGRIAAFRHALAEAGYVEGRNVSIEYRWAEGEFERLPELAADLVRRRVSVIAVPGSDPGARAAKAATSTIPIVFGVGGDPVGLGLVANFARPGGNATGINFLTAELGEKRVGLLRELLPAATRLGVLLNPSDPKRVELVERDVRAAARSLQQQVHVLYARTIGEIDEAFPAFARERIDALFVGPDPFFNSRRVQFAIMAARYMIPASYAVRDYVEAGGLMSYGTNTLNMYRHVGVYTAKILQGATPAELPVERSTTLELVINRQAARAIGLAVPERLLVAADEVIE
jgi:putative ABC transport system substrate-binding protein